MRPCKLSLRPSVALIIWKHECPHEAALYDAWINEGKTIFTVMFKILRRRELEDRNSRL
jgi:hypothetical protein